MHRLIFFIVPLMVAVSLGQDIGDKHYLLTEILQVHVNGGLVDYKNLKNDNRLGEYLKELSIINPDSIEGTDNKLAYWINAYNAYTLKIICDNYPLKSINELHTGGKIIGHILGMTIWDKDTIVINKKHVSLNYIEHDVIRKNFAEPRIHFTLVCASMSCPKLLNEAYEGYKLDKQLENQTKDFFNDLFRNKFDLKKREAYLSKILDWYESDFGENEIDVLKYIADFLPPDLRENINNYASEWDIEYKSYSWALNDLLD